MPDDFDLARDSIAQALMDQPQAGGDYFGEMGVPGPTEFGEMGVPSPGRMPPPLDRDAQIQQNAAPPGFMGMPPLSEHDRKLLDAAMGTGASSDRDRQMQEAAAAGQSPFQARPAQDLFQARPAPVSNVPILARGANSPPLPAWVGRFAPPSYPYGRKR